jgi:hypothetical protein
MRGPAVVTSGGLASAGTATTFHSGDECRAAGPASSGSGLLRGASYEPRERWSPAGTWNRQRILAALVHWTQYTGEPPRSYEWNAATAAGRGLSTARVRLWATQYPRWPSTATVTTYFDRWSKALTAAGLKPHRNIAPGQGRAERVHAAQRMARDRVPIKDIAEILAISPRTARAYLTAGHCADCGTPVITAELCPKCASRRAARPRIARAQALRAIRNWTQETGHSPRVEEWAPTNDPSHKWAREYPRWPSNVTIRTHFGSWSAALEAAGLPVSRKTWDPDSIVLTLQRLGKEFGRPPKLADLDHPGQPARGTVRAHFGSFGAALEAAGYAPWRRYWNRKAILQALVRFEARHGRLPSERDWSSSSPNHPHASTARQQFGSWRHMLDDYTRQKAELTRQRPK